MNFDNWKLATPPTQGFTIECKICNELFETAESKAIEFEQFCSTVCENDANYLSGIDPADHQDFTDNQNKE